MAIIITAVIPKMFKNNPYLAMTFTLTAPLLMAIAFGGVAIGNMNA